MLECHDNGGDGRLDFFLGGGKHPAVNGRHCLNCPGTCFEVDRREHVEVFRTACGLVVGIGQRLVEISNFLGMLARSCRMNRKNEVLRL